MTQTSTVSSVVFSETIIDSTRKVPEINYKPSPFPNKQYLCLGVPWENNTTDGKEVRLHVTGWPSLFHSGNLSTCDTTITTSSAEFYNSDVFFKCYTDAL